MAQSFISHFKASVHEEFTDIPQTQLITMVVLNRMSNNNFWISIPLIFLTHLITITQLFHEKNLSWRLSQNNLTVPSGIWWKMHFFILKDGGALRPAMLKIQPRFSLQFTSDVSSFGLIFHDDTIYVALRTFMGFNPMYIHYTFIGLIPVKPCLIKS